MGGTGSGKITNRRKEFANDYVYFDAGEIINRVKKEFSKDASMIDNYTTLTADIILGETLESKRNIVIEIIGEKIRHNKILLYSVSFVSF